MADYDSYDMDRVNRIIFDDGMVAINREGLEDNHKLIYDAAIHKFLQEQSVRYRKLNSLGVREGIYMAIVYLGVPVEEFAWMSIPIEELAARANLYKLTGEVTL